MMERRILDAAIVTYGQKGWSGFNLDAVAREAGVSKDALYRRWNTRATLLDAAIRDAWSWFDAIDSGSLEKDLLALGQAIFRLFTGPYGDVAFQLRGDARRAPELAAIVNPYREHMVRSGRAVLRRAIDRGELAPTNRGLVLDLLVGSVTNHILTTPPPLRPAMVDAAGDFIRSVVTVILAGCAALGADASATRPAAEPHKGTTFVL